jgi:hypothetical protein
LETDLVKRGGGICSNRPYNPAGLGRVMDPFL